MSEHHYRCTNKLLRLFITDEHGVGSTSLMALKSKVYAASVCVCHIYDLVAEVLENRWSSSHRFKECYMTMKDKRSDTKKL